MIKAGDNSLLRHSPHFPRQRPWLDPDAASPSARDHNGLRRTPCPLNRINVLVSAGSICGL
jgi:hypothetical protein